MSGTSGARPLTTGGPARFFRIIDGPLSTLDDYRSKADFGWPPPNDPIQAWLWDGISVFATLSQARRKARALDLGSYVAELVIPPGSRIRWARTLQSSGHHTLWGAPTEVQSCEVAIHLA